MPQGEVDSGDGHTRERGRGEKKWWAELRGRGRRRGESPPTAAERSGQGREREREREREQQRGRETGKEGGGGKPPVIASACNSGGELEEGRKR